ncbi:MAG TPA: hypothetical protein VN894_07725 [Polyangiaceae bacterium]|nr:hypothetical protein [Polyangiaceae bacterium]
MSTGRKPSGANVLGLAAPSDPAGGAERPSIEAARRRLGGRATGPSQRAPGTLVQVRLHGAARTKGILLWATARHCDIWFEDGIARRARFDSVTACAGPTPDGLARVAGEMRLFTSLAEGERVRWERASEVAEGCIVEKCRYGAIIVSRDGRVVAVGFRKLWPAVVHGVA